MRGMAQFTSTTAAERIGCSVRTVRRLAVQHSLGSRFGRDWSFTGAEIRTLQRVARKNPGNPNWFPGYNLRQKAEQA